MESRPLKQAIKLALDTRDGSFSRREVAEVVLRSTTRDAWSSRDEKEARVSYIMSELATYMRGSLSEHDTDLILRQIPASHRNALKNIGQLPRCICISARGGRDSQHVHAITASVKEWHENADLKGHIAEKTQFKRNEARGVADLLTHAGVNSLSDLIRGIAA
jgi:hypothetical protein